MREILFRGKLASSGEWVYGSYVHCPNPVCIGSSHPYCMWVPATNPDETTTVIEVDPETVGQYTGLTDKNGKRIFEGDICRFKRFNDVYVGKIVFNVKTASFIMCYNSIVGAYGEKATHKMLLSVCDGIEIIGNIHDNPELLGGENNGINR